MGTSYNFQESGTGEVEYVARWMHDKVNPVRRDSPSPPKRTPVYERTSRKRWRRAKAAEDAALRLQEQLNQLGSPSDPIFATVASTDSRGLEKEIQIKYVRDERPNGTVREPGVSYDVVKSALPSAVEGVDRSNLGSGAAVTMDVRIAAETRKYSCGTYYDTDYTNILSGAKIGGGTTSAVVYDNVNSEFAMLTAGHVITVGEKIYQPDSAQSDDQDGVATRDHDCCDDDYGVFANRQGDEFYSSRLAEQSAEISGVETWDSIQMHEGDSSWDVEKQGQTTGNGYGYIYNLYPEHHGVWTTCSTWHGDSGGPQYHRTGTYVDGREQCTYVALNNWHKDDDDSCPAVECGGNAGEYVESQFNVDIY